MHASAVLLEIPCQQDFTVDDGAMRLSWFVHSMKTCADKVPIYSSTIVRAVLILIVVGSHTTNTVNYTPVLYKARIHPTSRG